MKIHLILVLAVQLISCSGADSQTAESHEDLKPQKACETFNIEFISKITGWETGTTIVQDLGHSDGKRSICMFKNGNESLMIRLAWKSEKAIQNKSLERKFSNYLTSGENGINYKALDNNQTLLGEKPADTLNPPLYIYRKRFGNKAEITLEFSSNKMQKEGAIKLFETTLSKLI